MGQGLCSSCRGQGLAAAPGPTDGEHLRASHGAVTPPAPSFGCVLFQLCLPLALRPALLPFPCVFLPSASSPISPRGSFGEGTCLAPSGCFLTQVLLSLLLHHPHQPGFVRCCRGPGHAQPGDPRLPLPSARCLSHLPLAWVLPRRAPSIQEDTEHPQGTKHRPGRHRSPWCLPAGVRVWFQPLSHPGQPIRLQNSMSAARGDEKVL